MGNLTRVVSLMLLLWLCSLNTVVAKDITAEISSNKVATINHVIIAWLKEPGNAMARRRFIEVTKSFSRLPGVVTNQAGKVLISDRAIVDSSFDVAAVITFESKQALSNYLQHPVHKKALEQVLQPLVKKIVVYDFISD